MSEAKTLSGDLLKVIACVSMTIDHVGVVFLPELKVLRILGRPAFVIFAFLLVEGEAHTHDIRKYALRLGVFGLLSEAPFDFASYGRVEWKSQNVYLTLLLGLLMLWALRGAKSGADRGLAFAAAALANSLLCGDYNLYGIFLIYRLWETRRRGEDVLRPVVEFALLVLAGMAVDGLAAGWFLPYFKTGALELGAVLAIPLLKRYSPERKERPTPPAAWKYLFYAYYPLHLGIFALMRI